ncbi:MAG: hypothetical protein HS104_29685 [Polyangiaceae bacterium]|nr:hypothetical protein [Polyangiaceae bacterium]
MALPDAGRYFPLPRAAGSAKSRATRFNVHLVALPASTALGEVERPQAAKRPRTRGWGQHCPGGAGTKKIYVPPVLK